MSFQIALSGINAASSDLSVIANNIANSATLGFKESRLEFSELVTKGVQQAAETQQFGSGTIEFTGNNFDMAISGEGFFTLEDEGSLVYSRSGAFGVDNEGFVVNSFGQRLQVFPEAGRGVFDIGNLVDLRLAVGEAPPRATTGGDIGLNLPASAGVPVSPVFDPLDVDSFNNSASTTVFDSLGAPHVATFYFVKGASSGEWATHLTIDGDVVGGPQSLQFDSEGQLQAPANGVLDFPPYAIASGANDLDLSFDFDASTQFGDAFTITQVFQDGFGVGLLTGIDTDTSGVVSARFSNGTTQALGQIALSSFTNPQGLRVDGDNTWVDTTASGEAVRGVAGSSRFGLVQSGALEQSNVDLTTQLVDMIISQQFFQANAQMISTQDEIQQTIINL
ncbi:MAG: flagellar hook protein FlgE [Pseudomonadota bacterium]